MKEIKNYQEYGDGVVGASRLDQIRANLSFGRELLTLSERLSHFDRAKSLLRRPINTAILALTLSSCGPIFSSATPSPTPTATETLKPSASPSFLPSISPSASPSKGPGIQQNQETYTLLNIESESWAAATFGADDWSKNPANWESKTTPEGDKYVHLKQRPNEVHTIVDLTKDSRAVGQAWAKIKTTDSGVETINGNVVTNAQAEVIVFKGLKAEVKEITIRLADNVNALLKDSVAKMVAKEATEQPGTPVLECAPIDTNVTPYSLLDIQSEAWAAQTFGADDWSKNPANWESKTTPEGDKYVHLKQRPNGVHSMVDLTKDSRAVGQAWIKIKTTDSGVERFVNNQVLDAQAETIVFRNEKGEVKEVTIRIADNTNSLMADSFNKMVAKEAIEQPGTSVLPCQPSSSTQSVPTPTPTLPPAK